MGCEVLCFFNDTATTEIFTLSLHDALPISEQANPAAWPFGALFWPLEDLFGLVVAWYALVLLGFVLRSEEHTSELQSRQYLVWRLLLQKKNIHFFVMIVSFLSFQT